MRKKIYFKTHIIVILLFSILPACGIAAGHLTQYGTQSLNLSGEWDFTPSGSGKRQINVPGFYAWKSRASDRFILQADPLERWLLIEGYPEAVYEKTFDIPASMAGKNIFLRYNAVNFVCDVYLNDTFLGRHKGGYVPFEFNISHIAQIPSSGNKIRVEIKYWTEDFLLDTSNEQLAAWPTGFFGFYWDLGITDSVYVIARPDIYIDDIYVQTSVRENRLKSGITLINLSGETKTADLSAHIAPAMLPLLSQTIQMNPGETVTVEMEMPWTGPYWSPENPELHDLVCHLSENSQTVHSRVQRFGFREFRIQDDGYMLNEIPFALRGENIVLHGEKRYWPYLVPDRENWAQIVDSLLALNFNVIRLHHNPPPSWMIEICDEKGMLVIGETAIYIIGAVPHNNMTYVQNSAEWQRKWIKRDRNHPSIIMWCAENEMGRSLHNFNPAYLELWGQAILNVDNTRPIIYEGDYDNFGRAEIFSRHYVYGFPNGWPEGSIYDLNSYKHESKPSSHGEFEWNRGYVPGADWARRQLVKTRIMRIGRWADIRPYRLDWSWHPHPDFFTDNYGSQKPDQKRITFLKQSFSPVAVFDKHYYEFERFPDPPAFDEADIVERTVYVLNDEMQGAEILLRWDVALDGRVHYIYTRNLNIQPGSQSEEVIEFKCPIGHEDSNFELRVSAWKDGVKKYEESYVFRSKNIGLEPVEILYGDVDNDGELTALDAIFIFRTVTNLPPIPSTVTNPNLPDNDVISGNVAGFGDFNRDGAVNALDAIDVFRHATGLPPRAGAGKIAVTGTPHAGIETDKANLGLEIIEYDHVKNELLIGIHMNNPEPLSVFGITVSYDPAAAIPLELFGTNRLLKEFEHGWLDGTEGKAYIVSGDLSGNAVLGAGSGIIGLIRLKLQGISGMVLKLEEAGSCYTVSFDEVDFKIDNDSITSEALYGIKSSLLIPADFSLSGYPNPFNSRIFFRLGLPESGDYRLNIYNIRGQLVSTLLDSRLDAGYHEFEWNGTDRYGQTAESGMYICHMQGKGTVKHIKIVYIK